VRRARRVCSRFRKATTSHRRSRALIARRLSIEAAAATTRPRTPPPRDGRRPHAHPPRELVVVVVVVVGASTARAFEPATDARARDPPARLPRDPIDRSIGGASPLGAREGSIGSRPSRRRPATRATRSRATRARWRPWTNP
jgi:hypothetical protein